MNKATICVMFGGKSSEYNVSLRSVYGVLTNIDENRYNVIKIGVTKNGEWLLFSGDNKEIIEDTWVINTDNKKIIINPWESELMIYDNQILKPIFPKIDVIFPVMHGEYVEDGRLQGLFDMVGIKYIGCDSFSSHICMDKHLTKRVAQECGIMVAKWIKIQKNSPISVDNFDFPVYVKRSMSGSSIDVYRVENKKELFDAIQKCFLNGNEVLIEEEIKGREVEVALMECGGEVLVSRVGMIKHGGKFYDYEEKYRSHSCEYIIPAPIEQKTEKYIRKKSKELFKSLGCKGLCRIDFFVKKSGEVVFNEVNTMPGFTEISMFPKLFTDYGFTYGEIIDCLINQKISL